MSTHAHELLGSKETGRFRVGIRGDHRPVVVLVSPSRSTFVETDLQLLSHRCIVRFVEWTDKNSFWSLRRAIRDSDAVFSWFAGDHALAATLLARRYSKVSFLVAGGADTANMPEIEYGAMAGSMKSRLASRWSTRLSSFILALSDFSAQEIRRIAKPQRLEVVYLGVDTGRFCPAGDKEDLVLSIGTVSQSNLRRKGLDVFIEAARRMPDTEFALGGQVLPDARPLLDGIPKNLTLTGFLPADDLLAIYRRARVYVQVSAHEGFGLALAEAMACECVPVVTQRGSIPEVVGATGIYVPYGRADETADGIRKALLMPHAARTAARERIMRHFSIEERASRINALLDEYIGSVE
jgi:glycosyltransferase involved in cell wall biosynthesis